MNLFKNYEEEFITGLSNINKKIEGISLQNSHKKELAFSDIKSDLTECERSIKLMETEIAGMRQDTKFDYLRKVRQYKKEFDNCRKSLFKAEEDYVVEKNKEILIGAELDEADNHKSKFIRQGELLSDTTYKLKDGVRMMNQTFQISNNIESDLSDHTGRMMANRKKLSGIGDDLTKSGKIVKTMMNRIRKNKFVLFSVAGLIFLVIIIVIGVKVAKSRQEDTTPTN